MKIYTVAKQSALKFSVLIHVDLRKALDYFAAKSEQKSLSHFYIVSETLMLTNDYFHVFLVFLAYISSPKASN